MIAKEELVAQLSVKYPQLDKTDISDLVSDDISDADKALLVKFYKDAGTAPTASFWDDFLVILKAVEMVANLVIPIASAVNGVYAVGKI